MQIAGAAAQCQRYFRVFCEYAHFGFLLIIKLFLCIRISIWTLLIWA
jgi:hypothetical protein